MSLTGGYKSDGGKYEKVPEGVHQAALYAIYDLGTQKVKFGEKESLKQQILFVWQLSELREDGEPFTISKKYTKSLHEKSSLRKDIEAWIGKSLTDEDIAIFDPRKLLGKNCQLQIVHNKKGDKTYPGIQAIMACPKNMLEMKPTGQIVYDMSDPSIPDKTPDWIRNMIEQSAEWSGPEYEEPKEDIDPFV